MNLVRLLSNPVLDCLFLIRYCSILPLLKLQYVACIILYSPSLIFNSCVCPAVTDSQFCSFPSEQKVWVSVGFNAPFPVLQLFDCSNEQALQYQDLHGQ